jgi:integrase
MSCRSRPTNGRRRGPAGTELAEEEQTIQELLGHSDVATTMIYAHVLNRGGRGIVSPLDARQPEDAP